MIRATQTLSKEILAEVRQGQVLLVASSLAYTTVLSMIPALAVSFSIFQAFGGLEKLYSVIEPLIFQNLAEGAGDEVVETLRHFIGNANASAIGTTGLIGLIFTTMSMLSSFEKALNQVWHTTVQRSWFSRIASYWLFITLGPLGLSIAVGMATSFDFPLKNLIPDFAGGIALGWVFFTMIYKFVPSKKVGWIPAMLSGTFTAISWNLARLAYSYYTSRVLTYSKIYGSLGAIPIVLLWIYIAWVVILFGAVLSVILQRRVDIKCAPPVAA